MDNSFKTYTDKLAATLEQKNQAYGDSFTKSVDEDGTVKPNANIDFVFVKAMFTRKFRYAGIKVPAWLYQRANGY